MTEQKKTQEGPQKAAPDKNELLTKKILGQFTQYDINTLKSTLAAGLNDSEFNLFINTAVAAGLNPFLKQVIPVVYEGRNGRKFDIQVPVEGIEHLARQKEGWRGYELQLVCEKDQFKAKRENGQWVIAEHEIGFPRGKVMGAYCIASREGYKDVFVFMEINEVEHIKDNKMWGQWFNDMFKKHVKKRALREQYGIEVDDMENVTGGPQVYDNNTPSYQPQERKEIQQEPELEPEDMLQDLWDKISGLMDRYNIEEKGAIDISLKRFNNRLPIDLNPQELAAYARFLEYEGEDKKKLQQAAHIKPDEPKEAEAIQQEPEAKEEPKKPANEFDIEAEFDEFLKFGEDGQGELI